MNLWYPYAQMQTAPDPIRVSRTGGVFLHLEDGRRLIDGLASWWTACHGYNHPYILNKAKSQLETMPHVMFGGISHQPATDLAGRLVAVLPSGLKHVFFSDSGSVAVEVAMKMAYQFWLNQGIQGRHRFVSFENAYHGDTLAAMSVCDPVNSMHSRFQGVLLKQLSRPIPQSAPDQRALSDFLQSHRDQIAGVLIEPLVQGAGGMKFHSPESLRMIATACRENRLPLIADELATGFGRTGSMFACEQADVVPDIICLGKALTAGTLGMAATVATDEIFDAFLSDAPEMALMHGPTFMANPLACAVAAASIELFHAEPRLERVQEIEAQLREQLKTCRAMRGVCDVRVKGAVGVVQVDQLHHLNELRAEFIQNGVWLRPFRDMIYVTPPLSISQEELAQLCEAVVKVVSVWSAW